MFLLWTFLSLSLYIYIDPFCHVHVIDHFPLFTLCSAPSFTTFHLIPITQMATFYQDQDPSFVLGSFPWQNSSNNMCSFIQEGATNSSFSETMLPNNHHEYLQEIPLHAQIYETTAPLYEKCMPFSCISDPSLSTVVVKPDSNSSSMVVDQLLSQCVDQVTQAEKQNPMEDKRKKMKGKVIFWFYE